MEVAALHKLAHPHKVRHPRCVCNKLDFIPSCNSFTSDTEQTNYGNQARGIIIVKYNNKVIKSAIHYNYKNHIRV